MKNDKNQHSRENSKEHQGENYTLDQPVTRQMIARETGLSYPTVCRRLKEMKFVQRGQYIGPKIYKRILAELGYLDT